MQFGGLTGPGGEIGLTRFQATDASGLVGPGGWLVAGITSSNYTFDLTLNSVPVMAPGEYTGQISVSVTRAA